MSENEYFYWAFYLYLVAPILYCASVGASRRGWRGAALGALIGLPTIAVSASVALVIVEYLWSDHAIFFIQANVTAVAGAFVAGWSTRFIVDNDKERGG